MALTTGAFLSDSGNPSNGNGSDGDHYRDTANQNLWFKAAGSWTLVGNVNDDTPDGVGTFWLHGSGVPLNANGADNNYYRNTANQDIWFKQAGIWHLIFGTTATTSITGVVLSLNGVGPDAEGDVTLVIDGLNLSEAMSITEANRVAAENARDEAELARDAAITAGGIYADTTAGLAATVTTEYFYVVSAGTTDALDLYLNNAGVAVYKKTLPASSIAATLERLQAEMDKRPNLFSHGEVQCLDKSQLTIHTGTLTSEFYGNENVWKLSTDTGTGQSRFWKRLPRSAFGNATTISAAITIVAADAGSSGSFDISQKTAGLSTISTTSVSVGGGAYTSATTLRHTPVVLDPTCAYVDFNFASNKTSGDKTRSVRLRNPLICAGEVAYFRRPASLVIPNFFTDPGFFGISSTTFTAVRTIEGNEVVLDMSGTGTRQTFYQYPATGVFAPGNVVTVSAEAWCNTSGASVSADVTLFAYDSSGTQLAISSVTSLTSAATWQELVVGLLIPASTAYIKLRFVARAAGTTAKWRKVRLTSSSTSAYAYVKGENPGAGVDPAMRPVKYVSPAGNDTTGDGSKGLPYLTIAKGVQAALPHGVVVIREGDYTTGASIAGARGMEIMAHPDERVRLMLGTELTPFTKTGGYTNVYQAVLDYAPGSPGGFVWEHGTPEGLISAADRHPLQRGATHRLPSTRLHLVGGIAAVDAAPGGAWYWDSGTDTIYIRTPDGSDPRSNSRTYYVPSQSGSGFYGGTGDETVILQGIEAWYPSRGFLLSNVGRAELHDCFSLGSRFNGYSFDDTKTVRLWHCRAGGSGNDGFNGHNNNTNTYDVQLDYISHGEWSHDNYDDGQSYHENGTCLFYGGLWEYNGDRGIATSYGAHAICYAGTSRYNGQIDYTGGEGFCAIAAPEAPDSGVGTQMECINCLSVGNLRNYLVSGDANNRLVARQCISRDALAQGGYAGSGTGYYASVGTLTAYSCTTDNDTTAKATAAGGTVTIYTGTPLV